MRKLLRHGLFFIGSMVVGFVGYHFAAGWGGAGAAQLRPGSLASLDGMLGSGYRLGDLKILQRTSYYVEEKYVDRTRVKYEAMYDAALDAVERRVDSVLLQHQPGGRLLHVSVGSYNTTWTVEPIRTMEDLTRELGRVASMLESHLDPDDVPLPEVEYALINGMLSTLDPHSVLMPPEISREMDTENQGEFGGLGITITMKAGRLTVEYPLEDTPAWKAGIKPDDRIVRIEGESTVNMELDEAVSKLRGPPGEPVVISVMRDMFDEPKDFSIVRDVIRINPAEGELLEGGIAYLRIKSFNEKASKDMDAILSSLRRDLGGAPKGLILDLRGNPGGFLTQAVEVSDRFLASDVVVSTVSADGRREVEKASMDHTEPDYPVIVLTDANSASASEIVAGALKNQERAALVGERTFGKGSVQHLYANADDSKLKLTVAQYLTPGDRSIQSIGIPPDIETVAAVVQMRADEDAKGRKKAPEPLISLLWRERVSREADLDHHLEFNANLVEAPAYRVAFLDNLDEDDQERRTGKRNLASDWQVQLAREILLNSQGSRRADVVLAAAPVVERRRKEEAERIRKAFSSLGIDWSAGTQPERPDLSLELDLGPDGVLVAGQEEVIVARLTNRGSSPVHQVFASSDDEGILANAEFFFGRVDPGRTVEFKKKVKTPGGYGSEEDRAAFRIQDAAGKVLGETSLFVRTEGSAPSRYSWTLALKDDGSGTSKGDGDGVPEIGEVVDVEFKLTNLSSTPGREAWAKIRNESGKDLDLRNGVLELGDPAPGATVAGRFCFEVRGARDGWLPVELQVGDDRFDYGAILEAGFYDYAYQKEKIRFPVGGAGLPDTEIRSVLSSMTTPRTPPDLEVTRQPEVRVTSPAVILSGVVRDDGAVRDLIVYRGEHKVYYQSGTSSIPFTVEQSLEKGPNAFVVLAHDDQGLTLARQINVFYDAGEGSATPSPAR